ncbi:hypothetical protein SNK04_014264 [Fusarium graminearum]
MPWPEFKARENLAALRSGLAYAGAMRRLNPTGVSMNLTNRLRVEFGFDADGMIGANDISAATDLLINLHMWANSWHRPAISPGCARICGASSADPIHSRAREPSEGRATGPIALRAGGRRNPMAAVEHSTFWLLYGQYGPTMTVEKFREEFLPKMTMKTVQNWIARATLPGRSTDSRRARRGHLVG